MPQPLTDDAIAQAIEEMPGWRHEGDALRLDVEFDDFKQALTFIVHVGLLAESANHHPEIHSLYNRLALVLRTHDADGKVTAQDLALAKQIESALG